MAVTAALNETVIGIDLVEGLDFAPHAVKLATVLSGCFYFLKHPVASRLEFGGYLGTFGMFCSAGTAPVCLF